MISTYETIFICPGEISQEKAEASLEKVKSIITKSEGKIATAELWGRRKLAHTIRRNREGFYIYLMFAGESKLPSVLNHHYRVTDNILRGLTVKVDPMHIEKIRNAQKAAAVAAASAAASAEPSEVKTVPSTEAVAPQEPTAPAAAESKA